MPTPPPYQHSIQIFGGPNDAGQSVRIDLNSPSADAFNRLRVSNPVNLFEVQHQYDVQPLLWTTQLTGSGTAVHLPNESSVRMRVENASESVVRQTLSYMHYQPGESQQIMMTFVAPALEAGITRRLGYFDGANGVFFQTVASAASLVLRSSITGAASGTVVAQADWNIDSFDGSGPSGQTLDVAKMQIFTIDLEWLGTGRVRTGFVLDGTTYYAHQFLNANKQSTVYMTTANLPIRFEISSATGTVSGNYDLHQICAMVVSEGGSNTERGLRLAASNLDATVSVTTRRPVLSIRPKTTFNGLVNRTHVIPTGFSLFSDAQSVVVELVYGGTLVSGSFSSVSDHSVIEQDVSAMEISGGVTTEVEFVTAASQGSNSVPGENDGSIISVFPLALDIDGNHPTTPLTDVVSLVVTSIPGTTTEVSGALDWREIR